MLQEKVLNAEITNFSNSTKKIKNDITGKNEIDFFTIAQQIIDRHNTLKSIGTRDKIKSIVNKIRSYVKTKKLNLIDIDVSFLNNYENYCITIKKNKRGTVNRDLIFIRQVFNTAIRRQLITSSISPFLNYRISNIKPQRATLTQQEVNAIIKLNLSDQPTLDKHRDMFVFACYTGGLRISDVLLLTWDDIKDEHLQLCMRKTNYQTTIFLTKTTTEILCKYNLNGNRFIFGMVNDNINLSDAEAVDKAITVSTILVNRSLKSIAKLAKINKNISTHVARHTFATLALQKGIQLPVVQQVLGHSNIRETQIYAKILNVSVIDAVKKFDE